MDFLAVTFCGFPPAPEWISSGFLAAGCQVNCASIKTSCCHILSSRHILSAAAGQLRRSAQSLAAYRTKHTSLRRSPALSAMDTQVVPRSCLEVPWFARPPVYSEQEVEMYSLYPSDEPLNLIVKKRGRKPPSSRDCPDLPFDPRRWSRAEVCLWVEFTCLSHHLPLPSLERFLMNGKAVCLMSPAMFTTRVPLGGKLLYRDFQIRLAKAVSLHKMG